MLYATLTSVIIKMNYKGVPPLCSHEKRQLDILSLLQEVSDEKNQLQCDIDDIISELEQITDFFDQCAELPLVVLKILQMREK